MKRITTQIARNATPPHLGRRTVDEQAQLDAQRRITAPRQLRQMFLQTNLAISNYASEEAFIDKLMLTVNHWLRDIEHERRMAGEVNEQDVVSRIIEALGE